MLHDAYGNEVDTGRTETIVAIDRFAHSFIAYGTDFGVIFKAVEADPECVMARGHAALLGLFSGFIKEWKMMERDKRMETRSCTQKDNFQESCGISSACPANQPDRQTDSRLG